MQSGDLHGHGECSFLRIFARERHPGNIERVRESSKSLGPHNAKVSYALAGHFSENSVHNVGEQVHAETGDGGFSSAVAAPGQISKKHVAAMSRIGAREKNLQVVGNIAKGVGGRNLEEKTHGGHGVTLERFISETPDDGGRVGIECTLGTVVAERDDYVSIEAPVRELNKNSSK